MFSHRSIGSRILPLRNNNNQAIHGTIQMLDFHADKMSNSEHILTAVNVAELSREDQELKATPLGVKQCSFSTLGLTSK
jgi:hypothetical protein